jgi:transcriptional regulator with AAA-type ATPase domain
MSSSQISTKFKAKREEVSAEILQSIEKMSSFKNLKEVQVTMLSLRQRLLEDSHTLLEHLSVIRKKYKTEKSSQMENISENLQHRYQYNEKTVIIEGKTAATKEMMDLIENQINFFNESIKTVDNVLFGLKTRVEIEKTLGL